MKKHPVDDLFARKLTDWQPPASNDLWDRIEARQEKAPRRLGWYWYAAASIAILILAGYIVWQSQGVEVAGSKGQVATTESTKPATRREPLAENIISEKVAGLSSNQKTPNDLSTKSISVQDRRVKGKDEESVAEPNETSVLREKIEVAVIQKKEIAPESLLAETTQGTSLQPTIIQPPTTEAAVPALSTGRIVIAHVEPPPISEEEPKSSKFIRVLRQLKNAKQGEAIEWDEVGFNPKKLMARADEHLKNEEEKISKKYQELKDKTKL